MEKITFSYESDAINDSQFGFSDNFTTQVQLEGLNESDKLMRLVGQSLRMINKIGYEYENIQDYVDTYLEALNEAKEEDKDKEEKKPNEVGFKIMEE